MSFPTEYGGSNAKAVDQLIMSEQIAYTNHELSSCLHGSVVTAMDVLKLGTEEQKRYYIPKTIAGELRWCVGFTEPEAGSDAANIKTTAILDGDDFVINGHKVFNSTAHVPNTVIKLAVKTDPSAPKHEGISFIMVPNDTPGVEVRPMNTLGHRIRTTCEVYLTDARVPKTNLLGELHRGWRAVLGHHGLIRLYTGACNIGASQAVVDDAVNHAKQRVQFGQPISKFQAIAHMLVDMQVAVEAVRWLMYRAASLYDHGIPNLKEVCMVKLLSAETYVRVANDGMQVLGGYGYVMESDMQRHFRDARIVTVAGGSSQIQRNVIARQMGL